VEAGFITGISFAPWRTNFNHDEEQVGSWPIRFLLFKLMLMSGIVKIQANCPTWKNLTALEYHFATQCLPGPFAWHAHQLPPILLRLGVAATFVIEIPFSFLLVSPFGTMRKVGSWMQILLQVLIISTGNYNFFNLLTMTLCLPCMIGEVPRENRTKFYHRAWNAIQYVVCAMCLVWACKEMFAFERIADVDDPNRQIIGLKLVMSVDDCNEILKTAVPLTVACTLIFTVSTEVRSILRKRRIGLSSCTHCLVCCMCIAMTAQPLIDLSPNFHRTSAGRILSTLGMQSARRYTRHISHGYGLFRRMTGVGLQPIGDKSVGWAGLPPSIVARPEIILEVILDDSEEWRELNFSWKPGRLDKFPLQVAPHQVSQSRILSLRNQLLPNFTLSCICRSSLDLTGECGSLHCLHSNKIHG
jgi:hypothetical protein